MNYEELLEELKRLSEPQFALGEKRIVNDNKLDFLGVRTPALRKIVKRLKGAEEVFTFPDKYYEVVFIKLAIASQLPYEQFVSRLDSLVPLITDWALCDSAMKPLCVKSHREEFVPYIKKYIAMDGEFEQRFALIILLSFYVEKEWLGLIKECIEKCDSTKYYTMMGAAWLTAEVLVKHFEYGLEILNSTMCDIKVKNKAVSKACDSYRLLNEQKMYLKELRANFSGKTQNCIDLNVKFI